MNNAVVQILLADDDIELCEMLAEYLSPEGFTVDAAHDGKTALQKATTTDYDVIILDVMMPQLNGFEVLRQLRSTNDTPVLMLTARGEDVDRIVGLEMGADDYLPKPCNPRELVARVRAILRRTETRKDSNDSTPEKSSIVQVDDLELHTGSRSVTCRGESVVLTSTEYSVLEVLVNEAGNVVTKEHVSEKALGRELTRYDRSIDMHVSNLRKKLGPGRDGKTRIQTIRGIGYLYVRSLPE